MATVRALVHHGPGHISWDTVPDPTTREATDAVGLPGASSFDELMSAAPDTFAIPPTAPDDMALPHFASGTTGTPKGAVHVHEAVVAH
ncbi:AMP-binding protein [Streptomyces sp. NPDC048737]|uniref:AMP-binding protein n=1 Tax=Streptomyces sp. NPDC048737 TaxID=3155764 RepID=UPI0034128F55